MQSLSVVGFLLITLVALCFHDDHSIQAATDNAEKQKYVVYMGAKREVNAESLISSHHDILTDITGSQEEALSSIVYSYKHGFNGFSAWLTKSQADAVSKMPQVVSTFPVKTLQLHTTRSWNFLGLDSFSVRGKHLSSTGDVIVGVLDSGEEVVLDLKEITFTTTDGYILGVWPESESFSDHEMKPVPAKWKGICDNSKVKNSSETFLCNKKLIGSRVYASFEYSNARDEFGHGTHTTSTIAGSLVKGASLLGLGKGDARGGLPSARVAVYKVCAAGCSDDAILAAFDDAIHDGVDVLSLSLGGPPAAYDEDSIAIGSFHAIERGILVSCSAGNDGPDESSMTNGAPWIFTIGASTIDRKFAADIKLGNMKSVQGAAALTLNKTITGRPWSRLLSGADAVHKSKNRAEASFCAGKTLDPRKVNGNIIICNSRLVGGEDISTYLQSLGAAGVILVNDLDSTEELSGFTLPGAIVTNDGMDELLAYINSTSNATATILPAQTLLGITPAPAIAGFSSRGPNQISPDILKPDVVAPGVNILAAWSPESAVNSIGDPVYSNFNIISGTSMACPHATGAAAFVKSIHADWSPAAIRSALMTTAKYLDNTNSPIREFDGTKASPFAYGAGEINPLAAANPGLVYDISPDDYINYLCSSNIYGSPDKLELITGKTNVTCPQNLSSSYLNYPSITIPDLRGHSKVTVTRTVTNVGAATSVYNVTVTTPPGVTVAVYPQQLKFSSASQRLSFKVEFSTTSSAPARWVFGSLTWSDGSISVRSPLAVK